MFIIASEKKYKDGDLIFKEGSSDGWIYIVLSGSVEISRTLEEQKMIFAILNPDDVFGELSFFSGLKRTTTAIAIGNTTLGILDRHTFDHEFNSLSNDFRAIIRTIAERYEDLIDKFSEISSAKDNTTPKMLSLTFKDSQTFKKAYTSKYSKGSIFIKTGNPLKKGEKFILKLQLPDLTNPIQIQSEVEWTRRHSEDPVNLPPGMRINFSKTDKNVNHMLEEYINN